MTPDKRAEPRGCPTPGACSAAGRIAELERQVEIKRGLRQHVDAYFALGKECGYESYSSEPPGESIRRRIASLESRLARVTAAAKALHRQIEVGTFFDEHGHDAKMLKAWHDLRAALADTGERVAGKDAP